jgi:hypothetical protein
VELREAEVVNECFRVSGKQLGGIWTGGFRAFADSAVVKTHDSIASIQKCGHLVRPRLQVVGQSVHEQDGLGPGTFIAVVDFNVVSVDRWHVLLLNRDELDGEPFISNMGRLSDSLDIVSLFELDE